MDQRRKVIDQLAAAIASLDLEHPTRVAVDGRTASGKTTLAAELGGALRRVGRPVISTSIDGFHRPKAKRYRQGRHSPWGYYEDARDLAAVRRLLLDPLGPEGDRRYRTASFDLERDVPVDVPAELAAPNAILIVETARSCSGRPWRRDGTSSCSLTCRLKLPWRAAPPAMPMSSAAWRRRPTCTPSAIRPPSRSTRPSAIPSPGRMRSWTIEMPGHRDCGFAAPPEKNSVVTSIFVCQRRKGVPTPCDVFS